MAQDEAIMAEAIAAAAAPPRRAVSPRPLVGARVEPGGFVGVTEGTNGPHAEVAVLAAAGPAARGATLYSTLEPCSHTATTGPCCEAIIEAGVSRVVVGIEDPDPQVAGRGIARLREAGLEVEVGVRAREVEAQLVSYLTHRRTGRPYVVLKLAATLDGRTAAPDGSSRWITGEEARQDAHRLRNESDAVLVGAGTVRTDDPRLTVRFPGADPDDQPMRVVLGSAPADARIQPAVEVSGDLGDVLDDLGSREVLQLLVEGGATVAGAFHRAGLVDRYVIYLAPALFGGDDAPGLFAGAGPGSIDGLWRGTMVDRVALGDDLRIDLELSATSEVRV